MDGRLRSGKIKIFVVFEKRQKIDEMLMVAYAMMQIMRNQVVNDKKAVSIVRIICVSLLLLFC